MSEKEKQQAKTMVDALNLLPEDKRGYIIGYAEGVIAASEARKEKGEAEEPLSEGWSGDWEPVPPGTVIKRRKEAPPDASK